MVTSKRNKSLAFASVLCTAALIYGCKPKGGDGSTVAGVDELGSANKSVLGTRFCGDAAVSTPAVQPDQAFTQVLKAMPTAVLGIGVNLMASVDVRVEADAEAKCKVVLANNHGVSSGVSDACWEYNTAVQARPIVHIARSADSINKYLLATVVEAYDGYYVDVLGTTLANVSATSTSSNTPPAGSKLATVLQNQTALVSSLQSAATLRSKLTEDVLADLAANGQQDVVKRLQTGFGSAQSNGTASPQLQRFVLEEIFDAVYCSKASYDEMTAKKYTKTLQDVPALIQYYGAPSWQAQKS